MSDSIENPNTANPSPEAAPTTPDVGNTAGANERVQSITEKLRDLNIFVERNINVTLDNNVTKEKIAAASDALDALGDSISTASKNAVESLRQETALLPETLKALPDAAKEEGKTLMQKVSSIPGLIAQGAKTGWNAVADTMGKVGQFIYEQLERIKPFIARIIDKPFLKYFIDEKYIKMAQDFLGYDEESEQIAEEIRNRLPEGGTLNIISKAEKTTFKDLYDTMLSKQNRTPASYPRGVFIKDVIAIMIKDNVAKANTQVNIAQFATSAKKLIEATSKATIPATPAAPAPSAA